MENELEELYKELNEVKACDLDYLPKYGYSSKEEIIQLIEVETLRSCAQNLNVVNMIIHLTNSKTKGCFFALVKDYQDIVKLKNIYNEYNNDNPAA